jgi:hypothetical protein
MNKFFIFIFNIIFVLFFIFLCIFMINYLKLNLRLEGAKWLVRSVLSLVWCCASKENKNSPLASNEQAQTIVQLG